MLHPFTAQIYQTGINWCVDVPVEITAQMQAVKGYIRIKGQINGFDFTQTLVPVRNAPYLLFVNALMMKGGKTALGQVADFVIEQNTTPVENDYAMLRALAEALEKKGLSEAFQGLTPSRKKDILKYLSFIKTPDTLQNNIDKVIRQLEARTGNVRIP